VRLTRRQLDRLVWGALIVLAAALGVLGVVLFHLITT
jgi:hypothetical protein